MEHPTLKERSPIKFWLLRSSAAGGSTCWSRGLGSHRRGWQDETGRGLFVEHHGHSEHFVREQVNLSLRGLLANGRQDFGPQQIAVAGADHGGEPVCALVAAVYYAEGW